MLKSAKLKAQCQAEKYCEQLLQNSRPCLPSIPVSSGSGVTGLRAAALWSMNTETAHFSKLFISLFPSQHTTVLPLDMRYPLEGSCVEGLVHNWRTQSLR